MATKKKGIKGRNAKISSRKKPRTMAQRIAETQKLSKSFKEGLGVAATIAGPGKVFKAAKTIKQAANAVKIKKAKRKADILQKKKKPSEMTRAEQEAESARVSKSLPKRTRKLTKAEVLAKAKKNNKGIRFQGGRPKSRGKPTLRNIRK